MTQQEAEGMAKRLVRVWQPEKVRRFHLDVGGDMHWEADLRHNIVLFAAFYIDDGGTPTFDLYCNRGKDFAASLSFDGEGHIEQAAATTKNAIVREFIQRFLSHWMPLFRRGCWLCGADIEASVHEKMEWSQAFTPEELQAWHLKI